MWSDRDLLAKMLQAEAGNQGVTGMLAVGSVIDNRRRANGYGGNSWRDVMLAPGQFSPANSITGYAGGEQGVDLNALQPSETAYMVADQILSGKYQDPTGGALNFLNPDISQPSWLSTMGNTVKIGDHLFGTAGSGEGVTGRPSRAPQTRGVSAPQGVLSTQSEEPDVQNQMATGLFGALFPNMTADRQDRIAMALSGLSMNPNMGAMQMVRDRMDQRASDRKEAKAQQAQQAQQNRTIEWLAKTYGPEAAAAFEAAGNAGLQMWQKGQQGPASPNSAIAKLNADLQAGLITQEQWEAEVSRLSKPGMALSVGPDGEVQFTTGGAQIKPLSEGQSKDTTYATRAEGALPLLDKYDTELTQLGERIFDADPTGLLRGRFQDKEYQLAKQAGDEFLQAILRKDTGAAITADEQTLYGGTYLPQPGDGPEVIEQKRQSRRRALEALKAGMPPNAILAQERALAASGSGVQPSSVGKPQEIPQDVWDAMTDEERALWAN